MAKVLITAHRGMGVTAKRRDHFIDGAEFFPENSMAAFIKAIALNADALECDIHVSSDDVAMVLHGNKLRDYAFKANFKKRIISVPTEKDRISTCTADVLEKKYRLKTLTDIEEQLIALSEEELHAASHKFEMLWDEYTEIQPTFNQIPTLEDLLKLCAVENEKRASEGIPSLKLNIELKGTNAGCITLATILQYNKTARNSQGKLPEIDPSDIILLGRTSLGEIITAKSLLLGAKTFLDNTKGMSHKTFKKEKHHLLSPLMGTLEKEQLCDKDKNDKIKQELTHGKTARTIVEKYSKDNDIKKGRPELEVLRDFLAEVCKLSAIRTNVMLSTGDLYGKDAILSDDEDFDLKAGVHTISYDGQQLIFDCMLDHGYDGIDISLFDFEMETCNTLIPAIQKLKREGRTPIMGATASNWKGVKSEQSPITPAEAVLRAHYIAQTLDVDIILKVDEPGFFKELYQHILDEEFTRIESEALDIDSGKDFGEIPNGKEMHLSLGMLIDDELFRTEPEVIETITITGRNWEKFFALERKNYDINVPANIDFLSNSPKPPRGLCKKNSEDLFSPPSRSYLSEPTLSNSQLSFDDAFSPPLLFSLGNSFDDVNPMISLRRSSSFSAAPSPNLSKNVTPNNPLAYSRESSGLFSPPVEGTSPTILEQLLKAFRHSDDEEKTTTKRPKQKNFSVW